MSVNLRMSLDQFNDIFIPSNERSTAYKLNTKPNRNEQYKAYQKKNRTPNWIISVIVFIYYDYIILSTYIFGSVNSYLYHL
jgi:hypothetical protein